MNKTYWAAAARGFTLIELLVVIAIIGILASIILASLGTARTKGSDAQIKTDMHQIRNAADLYLNSHSFAYGPPNGAQTGLCTAAAGGSTMWTDTTSGMNNVINAITSIVTAAKMDCGVSASAWSVAVQLPTGAVWCVDYNGTAKGTLGSGTTLYTGGTNGIYGAATAAHTAAGATVCN